MIDLYVQKLYKDRLSKHVDAPEWLPEANTLSNVREFQSIKHAFGTTAGKQTDYFIPLQGVPKTFTHEGLRIKDGDLILSRYFLKFQSSLQRKTNTKLGLNLQKNLNS